MSEYICVFDCETIPDTTAIKKTFSDDELNLCLDESGKISDLKLSELACKKQEERTGSGFLPVLYHQIVCISAVMADKYGRFLRVSSMEGSSEKQMLENFLGFIENHSPRLVSFNGRGFDLPMMMIRAMKYNLSAPRYFDSKDKWCNYRSRYDGVWAFDLLDHISDFRAVSGLKLDALCAMLGMPGKYDIHGDQVTQLFYEGKMDKINEYCQSDTLNTYWLFLKYELLRGKIASDDYYDYLAIMSEYLKKNKSDMSYTAPFCECIKNELENAGIPN